MRVDRLWRHANLATMAEGGATAGQVRNACLGVTDGRIVHIGRDDALPAGLVVGKEVNAEGRWITPGLIDCHTHLVHGGNRAREFEMRLNGATYEDIARAGGGILSTVRATRAASEDDLIASALATPSIADGRGCHDR